MTRPRRTTFSTTASCCYRYHQNIVVWLLLLLIATTPPYCSRCNYCFAGVNGQQAPLYPIDSTKIEVHRTNFCERHNLVETGVYARRDALKGMRIRPALYPYQLDEKGVIPENDPGIGIVFMDAIAERAGFEWRDSYGVHPTPDSTGNQTWNDILYQTTAMYDMAGDWYWRTLERMSEGMLFPEGFMDGSLIMVGMKQDFANQNNFNIWAFMAPFDQDVWFLILGTMIASALVFYIIQYLENSVLNPWDSLFVTAFSFTGHYFFLPRTNAARLYSFSICALALMMVSAYTANFASFLVLLNQPSSSIDDIQDAVALGHKFCVYANSANSAYMTEHFPSAKLLEVVDDPSIFRAIDNGDCSIGLTSKDAWESAKGNAELNGDCNKQWIGRVVKFQQAGFPIGDSQGLCTSLLRDVVEIITVDMRNDGSFDRIWKDFNEKRHTNSCDASEEIDEEDLVESFRLGLNNVGGMFIFYGISLVVCILFALYSYWKERNNKEPSKRQITQVGDIMTRRGMRGSTEFRRSGGGSSHQKNTPPKPTKPAQYRRTMTDESTSRGSTSRYTDEVFTAEGDHSLLFSCEMNSGRTLSGLGLPDSNSLLGLQKLLKEKEARDKQLQQEISRLLDEVREERRPWTSRGQSSRATRRRSSNPNIRSSVKNAWNDKDLPVVHSFNSDGSDEAAKNSSNANNNRGSGFALPIDDEPEITVEPEICVEPAKEGALHQDGSWYDC